MEEHDTSIPVGERATIQYPGERYRPVITIDGETVIVTEATITGITNPKTGHWMPLNVNVRAVGNEKWIPLPLTDPFALDVADRTQCTFNGYTPAPGKKAGHHGRANKH